ncbi:ABC transporter substrate-binding protein [Rathayibacter sp. VKM Ac-2760]|uniref:ABC transporter substrate-binding protein n=1 Tax=Rathayibacter sp. VKM Ac-2760 TaxID=2609253 RepID=UPI001315F9D7|nr:ABC transporter substrate-binding protein [Rathayibacter sp. VKM Ac-2760]QHC58714.1 ABC transporter substrate-binding protein [Rathayibacter sp. VKM Ac-2760]
MSSTAWRRPLAATTTIVAVSLLTACSAAGGGAEQTRQVDTVRGAVEVPSAIDSVVVLEGRRDTDIVLALELPLVGFPARDAADGYELRGPLADAIDAATADGAEELFLVDEINLESIAEKAPSLIVSRSTEIEPIAAELEAIAPVVAIGNQDETTWQEDILTVGAATGTEELAQEWIDRYDARVAELKTAFAEEIAATPVVPFEFDDEGSDVGGQRLESLVLEDLGATPSAAFASALASGETVEFSYEQTLSAYQDAGGIYVFVTSADWWAELQATDLWQELPAVAAGDVVRGDRLTHDGGPITAMRILDQLEELYAGLAAE